MPLLRALPFTVMLSCLTLALVVSPVQSRDVKLLPYLLGTAPRNPKWLARNAQNDRKKFRQATCSFGALDFLNNLGQLTFMRGIVKSCPQSVKDSETYQPGEQASLPVKVCLLSVSALFGSLAEVARALTILVANCERSATVEEGCAASIETLLVPATLFINGGIAISAACDKGAVDLPKDIQPSRRLWDSTDLPVNRQWDIAQCTMDGMDAVRAIGALGLGLDAMARSCPVNRATKFAEQLSTAACTVDVSVVMSGFTRLVFYLALAVNHCSPEPERDAICMVGVSAIAAGMSTTSGGGAGTYATCQLGKQRQRRERLVAAGLLNASDVGATVATVYAAPWWQRRLAPMKWEDLEAKWLKLGYNLSDPTAEWLTDDESLERLAVREAEQRLRQWTGTPDPRVTEPLSEPLESSDMEVPCGLASPEPLRSRSAVLGEPVTLEDNATACQARCFRIPSCASFAFWGPGGQCHVLGFVTMPMRDSFFDSTPGWVSGPPSCAATLDTSGDVPPETVATREVMAQRHEACYTSHAMFSPLLDDLEPKKLASVLECQLWCEEEPRCFFFSYFSLSGLCHLSPEDAQSLHPVLNFVSGPKDCASEFIAESQGSKKPWVTMHFVHVTVLGQGILALTMFGLGLVTIAIRHWMAQRRGQLLCIDPEQDDAVPLAADA